MNPKENDAELARLNDMLDQERFINSLADRARKQAKAQWDKETEPFLRVYQARMADIQEEYSRGMLTATAPTEIEALHEIEALQEKYTQDREKAWSEYSIATNNLTGRYRTASEEISLACTITIHDYWKQQKERNHKMNREEQEARFNQALKDEQHRKILYNYLFELRGKYRDVDADIHIGRIETYLTCIPFDMDQLIRFNEEEWTEAAVQKLSTDHKHIVMQYNVHDDFRAKLIELGCIK